VSRLFTGLAWVPFSRFLDVFFKKFLKLLFFYIRVNLVFVGKIFGLLRLLGRELEKMSSGVDGRLKVAPIHLNLKYNFLKFMIIRLIL